MKILTLLSIQALLMKVAQCYSGLRLQREVFIYLIKYNFLFKEQCIRLSGLRKAAYDKQVNVIESLLGLDTHMTVKEICVRAACSELIEFAEKLLQRSVYQHLVSLSSLPTHVFTLTPTSTQMGRQFINFQQDLLAWNLVCPFVWKPTGV